MLPTLSELKAKRKQFNLTQSQLAELAGVSQSLIAKIESEIAIPSYDNAKKMFDTLEKLQEQQSVSAKDFMQQHVAFVHENDSAKKAVTIMEKKAISQLPVLGTSGACVGSITEENVLKKISSSTGAVDLSAMAVSEIMDDAFPSIQADTPLRIVQSMLEHNPAVLIMAKGKLRGIITKSDLLKAVMKKQ